MAPKRKFLLDVLSVCCCLIVVLVSASTMTGTYSRATLIGLIAGSFGAGAAFVNAIRDFAARRTEGS